MQVKITFKNNDTLTTTINGTVESVSEYYKTGRTFNIGAIDDNMQTVEKVQFYCEALHSYV